MGRRPVGKRALTDAERQARRRAKVRSERILPKLLRHNLTVSDLEARDCVVKLVVYATGATPEDDAAWGVYDGVRHILKTLRKQLNCRGVNRHHHRVF
jgi:hypothetical protein